MNMEKDKLQFYEINQEYIEYLALIEPKLLNDEEFKNCNIFVGAVFGDTELKWYAPITKIPSSHHKYKLKFQHKVEGYINFKEMFPVPDSEVKKKTFSDDELIYINKLFEVMNRSSSKIEEIRNCALKTFSKRIGNLDPVLTDKSFNFQLLFEKAKAWGKCHDLEVKNNPKSLKFIVKENKVNELNSLLSKQNATYYYEKSNGDFMFYCNEKNLADMKRAKHKTIAPVDARREADEFNFMKTHQKAPTPTARQPLHQPATRLHPKQEHPQAQSTVGARKRLHPATRKQDETETQ